jgi:hypothetical protein
MRNYDKIVIVCYPPGAGGNFLINCLSLTNQCVLRDSILAEQQLISGFDVNKKLKYLNDNLEISKNTKQWNDLNLGCCQLFGFTNSLYLTEYPEILETQFNYIIPQLIKQNKYLFIIAHTMQHLEAYQKFWTNSRVIFLTEYEKFIQQSGYKSSTLKLKKIHQYWDIVKDENWPTLPPLSPDEFLKLPSLVQQELRENYHNEIFKWFDYIDLQLKLFNSDVYKYQSLLKQRSFIWNVADTFNGNVSKCLSEFHRCAKWLNLEIEADDNDIINYYNNWLNTVKVTTLVNPSNKGN